MRFFNRVSDNLFSLFKDYDAQGLALPPDFGDPAMVQLQEDLEQGLWQAVRDALASTRNDSNRRMHVVSVAAECKDKPAWLDAWLQAEPDNDEAQLVAGALWVGLAWDARGGGYANSLTEEQIELFFERLERAQKLLGRAAKRLPEDPTPWSYLIRVARGLQEDLKIMVACFKKAIERDPHHFRAHYEMLQCVCGKWYGSREKMWRFANQMYNAAPPGSPICNLIALAHIEDALSISVDDEIDDPDQAELDYWNQPNVQRTTIDAFTKMGTMGDPSSLDHIQANSDFAYALWHCGAYEQAVEAFARLGDRLTLLPWALQANPAKAFRRARQECGLE